MLHVFFLNMRIGKSWCFKIKTCYSRARYLVIPLFFKLAALVRRYKITQLKHTTAVRKNPMVNPAPLIIRTTDISESDDVTIIMNKLSVK